MLHQRFKTFHVATDCRPVVSLPVEMGSLVDTFGIFVVLVVKNGIELFWQQVDSELCSKANVQLLLRIG